MDTDMEAMDMDTDMEATDMEAMDMDTDMEVVSQKPREGNKRSSNSYSYNQNCKRVGTPKRYGEDIDRWGKGRRRHRQIIFDCVCPSLEAMDTDTDMEAVSEKPREGNKRSSNSYTQNCKRVGAPKRYGKDRRGKCRIHKNKIQKACTYWFAGNCKYTADDCKYLHSHVTGGSDVTFLTNLVGHDNKPIRGIAFPSHSGTAKLYSAGQDNKLIVWDCQTGQGTNIPLDSVHEVGCLLSEGPWLFVGVPNAVRAWNTLSSTELYLDGPPGQVHALAVADQMLFAGTQDGTVLAWKFNSATNTFEHAASLAGHTLPVVSLVSGADRLYSASMDHTIRVWDLGTFQCIQTLTDHTSVVMSLLCWDQFLLSSSLDNTVKVWAATPSGSLEVTYTHTEEHGVLALCGMNDEQGKHVLLCSCNDNSVRLYDLPSFRERGRVFSRNEVRAFQIGPGGLFFTGDGKGEVKVWKWDTQTL